MGDGDIPSYQLAMVSPGEGINTHYLACSLQDWFHGAIDSEAGKHDSPVPSVANVDETLPVYDPC